MPPSTGRPPNSVSIGSLLCAWPTQTQAVKFVVPPQNQASPLLSVVPVLPHSTGSPIWALSAVPPRTFAWRIDLTLLATASGIARISFGL